MTHNMRDITVRFEDTDPTCTYLKMQPTFFIKILKRRYNVTVLTDGTEEPDVLFFSCFGMNNVKWTKCLRIYFSAESGYPDYNMCDYAIGLTNIGTTERFFHLPLYVFYNNLLQKYENMPDFEDETMLNREFCSIVVSNSWRNPIVFEFFNLLNDYKHIASGGRWRNNVGGRVSDKLDFISRYKFNVAFENMNVEGYITEKIFEPFVACTIPIYWGCRSVKKEVGEGAYIDISDFDTLDRAIDYIKKVDNDDNLYLQMLREKVQLPYTYDEWCDRLLNFLVDAIDNGSRIFNTMTNRSYEEKLHFQRVHRGTIGKLYRAHMGVYRAVRYFINTYF